MLKNSLVKLPSGLWGSGVWLIFFFNKFQSHNLLSNATKTKVMMFDPKTAGDHCVVTIKGQSVEQVTTYKYLGIHFDPAFQ